MFLRGAFGLATGISDWQADGWTGVVVLGLAFTITATLLLLFAAHRRRATTELPMR